MTASMTDIQIFRMIYTYVISRVIERKHRKKYEHSDP